jgi:hypothetical protein
MRRARFAVACLAAACLAVAVDCGGRILLGRNEGTPSGDASASDGVGSPATADAVIPGSGDGAVVDAAPPDVETQMLAETGPPPQAPDTPGYTTAQFNPHHCGPNGNDCMGGACQQGVCVPLPAGVLASGQLTPSSIVVDEINVYWVNESPSTVEGPRQILKCAKNGCNNQPTVIATLIDGVAWPYNNERGLAVDTRNIYWEDCWQPIGLPSGLFSCPIAGCNSGPPAELRQFEDFGDIALSGNHVFAIGAPILGADGNPVPVSRTKTGAGLSGVGPWQVFGCAIDGCDPGADAAPSVLWSTPQDPNIASIVGVALDTSNAYFASTINGTILTCPLTGCGGAPTVLSPDSLMADAGQLLPWRLATDEANVYWDLTRYETNLAGPAEGQVLACAKAGCNGSPTVLASGLRNPWGLVTDGTNVYFLEHGDTRTANAKDGRVAKCAVTGCSNQPTVIADNVSYPHSIAVDSAYVYWTDLGEAATPGSGDFGITSVDGRIMVAPK